MNREKSQLLSILKAHPHATFDLVGHSLGGVVAAYWASNYANDYMLGHIHSLITLDSPLQGVKGLTAEQIGMWFSGDVWGAIQPDSLYIKQIEGKWQGYQGVVDQLSGEVHTISDSQDGVVLSSQSWLPRAQDNKTITVCPLAYRLGECHGAVLSDSQAVGWATSWIES